MKHRKTGAFAVLLILGCLQAFAQTPPPLNEPDYNKPKVFADLPEKLILNISTAEALLTLSVGSVVNTAVAPGFLLTGTVVSKSSPADAAMQSVVIKSSSRGGAVFIFARRKAADGTFSYTGRMLGKSAGDALEIIKDGATYVFRKKGYYDLLNE